jgi:hypothetical protein
LLPTFLVSVARISPPTTRFNRLAGDRHRIEAAAGTLGVAAHIRGNQVGLVGVIAVQRAPRFERLQQDFLVLRRDRFIEPASRSGLGKELGDLTLKIGLDGADALLWLLPGPSATLTLRVTDIEDKWEQTLKERMP